MYDSFLGYLSRAGFAIPQEVLERDTSQQHQENDAITRVFTDIYRDHLNHHEVYSALESLLDLDEQFTIWRYRHMMMVRRMIGSLGGTGGSPVQNISQVLLRKTVPRNLVRAKSVGR